MIESIRNSWQRATSQFDAGKIPITIAVTGQRRLQAESLPLVKEAVDQFFRVVQQRYPASPLRLLCGLDEGSDRVVARAAIQHSVELVAVLPLPPSDYEKDFGSPKSVAEFYSLLQQARRRMVVGNPGVASSSKLEARRRQAAFLVEECDLFLALWDVATTEQATEAAEVVKFRLEGLPRAYSSSASYLSCSRGVVYQIFTPCEDEPALDPIAGSASIFSPGIPARRLSEFEKKHFAHSALDDLNRDLRHLANKPTLNKYPKLLRSSDPSSWSFRFRRIDTLAAQFQRWMQLGQIGMVVCSVSSMICLQRETLNESGLSPYFLGYVVLLFSAFVIYGASKYFRLEVKAFDYRALAEAVRIQAFWTASGAKEVVSQHYLLRQQSELKWIRDALRDVQPLEAESAEFDVRSRFLEMHEDWLKDQLQFFSHSAKRQQRLHRGFRWLASAFVWAGFLVGMMRLAFGADSWFMSWVSVLPLLAASLLVYSSTRAWSEQFNRYEVMRDLYAIAELRLRELLAANDLDGAREIFLEVGKEALAENAEWLTLHRNRMMKAPSLHA